MVVVVVVVVGGLEVWDEKEGKTKGSQWEADRREYGRIPRWRGGVAPSNTTK